MSRNFLFENENGSIVRLSRLFVALGNVLLLQPPGWRYRQIDGLQYRNEILPREQLARRHSNSAIDPERTPGSQAAVISLPVKHDGPILSRS